MGGAVNHVVPARRRWQRASKAAMTTATVDSDRDVLRGAAKVGMAEVMEAFVAGQTVRVRDFTDKKGVFLAPEGRIATDAARCFIRNIGAGIGGACRGSAAGSPRACGRGRGGKWCCGRHVRVGASA